VREPDFEEIDPSLAELMSADPIRPLAADELGTLRAAVKNRLDARTVTPAPAARLPVRGITWGAVGLALGFTVGRLSAPAVHVDPGPPTRLAPPKPVEPPEVQEEASAPSIGEEVVAVTQQPRSASARAPASSPPTTTSEAPTLSPEETLRAEQTLLEIARAALVRRQSGNALAALARHREEHPSGLLAEEREALTVVALSLEDPDAGRAALDAFQALYPNSILIASIRQGMESLHQEETSTSQ
jgi:hypothetical protein